MPSTAKIWPFTNQQHGKLKGEKDPASSRHHFLSAVWVNTNRHADESYETKTRCRRICVDQYGIRAFYEDDPEFRLLSIQAVLCICLNGLSQASS
ncbi:hypothetical protein AXI58_11825 [Bacillus nakamurai]|uniref:Uncharacterized protein n=1 Tax=Bacillus nakamurai TaxID=1793963 RepID=A0A150F9F2_9BACI|nr:hypothetical protein AXI58_11825 [Bacillus nakamurai]